jgi:hypothetical protein
MAAGYYRFNFGTTRNSDVTVSYSSSPTGPFTSYSEPAWPPNNQNRGSVLQVNYNDTVYIQLQGPTGWTLTGQVQVVITRANSAASGQAYSPFGGGEVWLNPPGTMTGNVWQASLGTIAANPGQGNNNKFEITIAFNANLPGVPGSSYFSEDPEMQVEGM